MRGKDALPVQVLYEIVARLALNLQTCTDQYDTPPKVIKHTGLVVIPCDQVPIDVVVGVVCVDGVRAMGNLKTAENPVVALDMEYATI